MYRSFYRSGIEPRRSYSRRDEVGEVLVGTVPDCIVQKSVSGGEGGAGKPTLGAKYSQRRKPDRNCAGKRTNQTSATRKNIALL